MFLKSLFRKTRRNRTIDLIVFGLIVLGLLAVIRFLPEPELMDRNGLARVIDGDSIIVDSTVIRLAGIDAPELAQTCQRNGKEWDCGRDIARRLRTHLGFAPVACRGNRFDQHDRLLATCHVKGKELNRWLVELGWAVSFDGYPAEEQIARKAKRGLWAGKFERPSSWREGQRDRR
jgi:endonuclease YncB( thermonuclease family)